MPDCFAETPEGIVLIANGMQPVLRWNGLDATCEPAGVLPPTQAVDLSSSGIGSIVGDYAVYLRFVDQFGNFSNLSPPNTYSPRASLGLIQNITGDTPAIITSNGHGLLTGAIVKIATVIAPAVVNNTWTITVIDGNTFSLDGSATGGTGYAGGGDWVSGVEKITYTNVQIPTEPKVVRRQLLRNTDGQAGTYYVDVDTTDLTSTTFSSSLSDAILASQQAVPLLDSNGIPFADQFVPPPAHKTVLAHHLDRMFAAAEITYTQGSVAVSFGSPRVQGIGTEWTESLPGRFLYVKGAGQSYEIASVDTVAQTLTLLANYQDLTNPYADYAIRPAPAERRLVYYSEAGNCQAWPPINAIGIEENNDEITGLMVTGSFLFILERRHIHKFTFQDNPAKDGTVFEATSSRGCLNQRCWVSVEDSVYCLDEQGVHAFDGGDQAEPVSQPIQDIFRFSDSPYEINWAASDFFHAVHYPPQETVRWFVALSGHYLPRHALCYNYRLKRWWLEEYYRAIGASLRGTRNGRSVVYLGADAGDVLALWSNTLDGPDASAGTVRGTVTTATLLSITDAQATYANSGLVNSPLAILDGTGTGQTRRIVKVDGQTLYVDRPWMPALDSTSVYQLGGIAWQFRTQWFRYGVSEQQTERRIELIWEPTKQPAQARLRVYQDTEDDQGAVIWKTAYNSPDANGVRSQAGSPDLVVDLTKKSGFAQKRMDSRRETYTDGPRFMAVDIQGVASADEQVLYQLTLDGVVK